VTEHLVIRTNLSVALIRVLQGIMPAVVAAVTLPALALLFDVHFDQFYIGLAAITAILSVVFMRPPRLASLGLQMSRTSLGIEIVLGWGVVVALLLALGFAISISEYFSRRVLLTWGLATPALILLSSILLQLLMRRIVLSQKNQRSAIIAGVNPPGLQLARNLREHPELCMRLVGFFDDRSEERLGDRDEHALLGRLSDLADFVKTNGIDIIFVALPIRHVQRVMALLDELRDTTASLYFVPDIFMYDLIQARTGDIWGVPVVAMCETPFYGYRGVMKRITDLSLTAIALLPALPIMVVLALLIKSTSRGPAIFRQTRYGLDGREIIVFKFRSMYVTEDGPKIPQATRDDPRITPIGRFMRKRSLDELPQLFNVLQGRMSLVGPRPHAVAHNEQYRRLIKGYMIRHKVLPGLTGLAQVSGCRGETADVEQMQARVNYDLDYLRHWTPVMDVKILFRTFALLLRRDPKAY
jgi:putative colanic acid biosynthesis UDP-glucose lipid carrier transferase